ncbi:hypothetical protein LIPSTDRAFT_224859 [Lipomyces starkeyi NRRL Y-11557]|uniref:Uncharacterized protein n=1 Tax=Lipomyces starkeyi NRRL Y-11557 TaxID=675824 RepID=A0A1E3PTY6_LIPST|nr:hypothetical protein LIPSTDRAFT_224859 [Lipomyces starkeyi NRRL Y-11557]
MWNSVQRSAVPPIHHWLIFSTSSSFSSSAGLIELDTTLIAFIKSWKPALSKNLRQFFMMFCSTWATAVMSALSASVITTDGHVSVKTTSSVTTISLILLSVYRLLTQL